MAAYQLKERGQGGVLYVHWTDLNGKLHRKSADTTDRKVARVRAPMIIAGQFAAPTPAEKVAEVRKVATSAITMARLLDRCRATIWTKAKARSQGTIASNIKILNGLIGDELATDMTYGRLERLVVELRDMGYAEGTIDRKLSTVGAALTQATKEVDEEGRPWLVGKPAMPHIVADNFCERVISKAEEAAIFAAIKKRQSREPTRDWRRFGHLLRFLMDTGCRLGEALGVTDERVQTHLLNDVERTAAYFPRYRTKNKKPRVVWLTKAVVETLPVLRANAIDGRLFHIKPATAWYMWSGLRDDLKAEGFDMDDVKLHTFRHTCLTRMAQSGKFRIENISDWAGHSSIQITIDRYRHLLPSDSAHLVDHLDAMAGV
jgi:integrase